jgi:hypothetical protein
MVRAWINENDTEIYQQVFVSDRQPEVGRVCWAEHRENFA